MIDHMMVNCKWVKSLRNARVHREADVLSDHHLLVKHYKHKLPRMIRTHKNVLIDSLI